MPSLKERRAAVGERLRWAREEIEPNATVVARYLEVDPSTLNKWEAGTRLPDVFKMADLAENLRITLDYLYRGRLEGVDRELALRLAAKHPELVLRQPLNGTDQREILPWRRPSTK